jgi:hypothetical protein
MALLYSRRCPVKKHQGASVPDPEPRGRTERTLRHPTQCVLWRKPELVASPVAENFEVLETLIESSHWDRVLLKCRECGQVYFFEFYETIDWDAGDDSHCSTYIPVQTPEEVEVLKKAPVGDLSLFSPRLLRNYPTPSTVRWIGR